LTCGICSPVEKDSKSAFNLIVVFNEFYLLFDAFGVQENIGKPQIESLLTTPAVT
jgi:hypothetical protein